MTSRVLCGILYTESEREKGRNKNMKNWKVWLVKDERNNKVLFEGRKKDAEKVWYTMWLYEGKKYIGLYSTNKPLQ